MKMEYEIAPCPFCGAECVHKYSCGCYSVMCGWPCSYESAAYHTKAEAIAAHNALANLKQENERLRQQIAELTKGERHESK